MIAQLSLDLALVIGLVIAVALLGGGLAACGLLFQAACRTYNHYWTPPVVAKPDEAVEAVSYQTAAAGPYTSPAHYEAADTPAAEHPDSIPVPPLLRSTVICIAILVVTWLVVPLTGGAFFGVGTNLMAASMVAGCFLIGLGVVIAASAAFFASAYLVSWTLPIPYARAMVVLLFFLAYMLGLYLLLAGAAAGVHGLVRWYIESQW